MLAADRHTTTPSVLATPNCLAIGRLRPDSIRQPVLITFSSITINTPCFQGPDRRSFEHTANCQTSNRASRSVTRVVVHCSAGHQEVSKIFRKETHTYVTIPSHIHTYIYIYVSLHNITYPDIKCHVHTHVCYICLTHNSNKSTGCVQITVIHSFFKTGGSPKSIQPMIFLWWLFLLKAMVTWGSSIWVCLKMGYTPKQIAIRSRDNDQQNQWV